LGKKGGRKMGQKSKEAEERRIEMAEGIVNGGLHADIGREVGVARSFVSQLKGDLLDEWKRANIGAIDDMVSREIMRIDNLEEVVKRDYESSKRVLKPMEYAALMARGLSMDEIDECFASRPQSGDPRYLDTLLRIGMQRMRLIGAIGRVDKRKQVVNQYNFGNLSEEDMRRIVGEMQDAKFREGGE